ncbi:MAG: hypothetical protein U9R01_00205, partial [candidate division WOR-3 bacterium]|nr:hypothetical protein [candidate division WOR-3 bacterium]
MIRVLVTLFRCPFCSKSGNHQNIEKEENMFLLPSDYLVSELKQLGLPKSHFNRVREIFISIFQYLTGTLRDL